MWRNAARCLLSLPVSFCRTVAWCHQSFALLLRFSQSCHSIPCFSSFSSNPCLMTIFVMLSIICLRCSTFPTNTATSLHPLHVNIQIPQALISAQDLGHPKLLYSTQLLQVPQTKFLLAIALLLEVAISRSNVSEATNKYLPVWRSADALSDSYIEWLWEALAHWEYIIHST